MRLKVPRAGHRALLKVTLGTEGLGGKLGDEPVELAAPCVEAFVAIVVQRLEDEAAREQGSVEPLEIALRKIQRLRPFTLDRKG